MYIMKKITLIPILSILVTAQTLADIETGYYWVDYDGGEIPSNALKVHCGVSAYVGQVYTKEYELLPATIHDAPPYAIFNAYNKELTANKNIKILCSQFKQNFKWLKTSAPAYKTLPNLVVGGTELGGYQYFGRIFRNGKAILGKLAGALALPLNGQEEYIYNNFEVLVYTPFASDHPCSDEESVELQ